MGYISIEFQLPTDYSDELLKSKIKKDIKTENFSYSIEKQSLDARNHRNIYWNVRVGVYSDVIKSEEIDNKELIIPNISDKKQRNGKAKAAVIGSGPAGFFAAFTLLEAGFDVVLFELGPEVYDRIKDVKTFEKGGELNERSNYAFGEGGAGTFSDGKLTCRTKTIKLEKKYIFKHFIKWGAPAEIEYLSKPHVGSNILTKVIRNMRKEFIERGGVVHFDTMMTDFNFEKDSLSNKVTSIETEKGKFDCDYLIIASGHSSSSTYNMLFRNGVKFINKPFAIGSRVEHTQELINLSQWSAKSITGLKSADYAVTYNDSKYPVYSFCMCPGGMVVPAAPRKKANIVNGMSNYKRNYPFANSAIVASFTLENLLKREVKPEEGLEWLEMMEEKFYNFAGGYNAPSVKVSDLINNKTTLNFPATSYPFDLISADFNELMPAMVINSMKEGLKHFNKKIKNFEEGHLIGLESRTSAPIQVVREVGGRVANFSNLFFIGEGSGFSGGIISSAGEGVKTAVYIAENY